MPTTSARQRAGRSPRLNKARTDLVRCSSPRTSSEHQALVVVPDQASRPALEVAQGRPLATRGQQVAVQSPQARPRRPFRPRPAQPGRGEGRLAPGVGHLALPGRRRSNSFFRPSRTACTQLRVAERAEEGERVLLAVLLAHEQQRQVRRQQEQLAASRCLAGDPSSALSRSPLARLPTWSWFWRQTTKRSPERPSGGAPCLRPRNGL